jgi:hypothetical protein
VAAAAEWHQLIESALKTPLTPVMAHTYRNIKFGSHSSPVVLACSDGNEYVVKGKRADLGKANSNDQIIGRLGCAMGAPVPPVTIVNVPADIPANQEEIRDFPSGLGHGSQFIADASRVKQGIANQNVPGNRSRFAALAVMYGWACVQTDHQFFYRDGTNLVMSFDHGHFFPGGPNWSIQHLKSAPEAVPDAILVTGCQLMDDEISQAKGLLAKVTSQDILAATAAPPAEWGLTLDERVEMAIYLEERRSRLLA